jgi:HlyD family secretion protein
MTPARRNRYILWGGLVAALALALLFAFWPRAVEAEVAEIVARPMSVTIDEEGETRIRDVYVVSAPVAGELARIVLEPGDVVAAGETVVATMRPADPAFLTVRTAAELEAAARAADAAVALAAAEVDRTASERELAESDLGRLRRLRLSDVVSERQLQLAEIDLRSREAAYAGAIAALDMRRAEAERARAALIEPSGAAGGARTSCCVPITAPVSGRVLRLLRESAGLAAAGEPLMEIGDPDDLEVVVDLLSTDAVRVREGDRVVIAEWGDGGELAGRVRRVEPYGFTKVSALGIEEQRVNVIVAFDSPADAWRRLGHGFRVEARIVVWSARDAIAAPLAALFREGDDWAVFVVRRGRALLQTVEVGHRNATTAEIVVGLAPGDKVVLHPSLDVVDGVRLDPRPAPASALGPPAPEAGAAIAGSEPGVETPASSEPG